MYVRNFRSGENSQKRRILSGKGARKAVSNESVKIKRSYLASNEPIYVAMLEFCWSYRSPPPFSILLNRPITGIDKRVNTIMLECAREENDAYLTLQA